MLEDHQATILTNPMLISIVLEKVKRKRSLLTVNIPNTKDDFLSIIIDIDDTGKYPYIDELKPNSGNVQFKKVKEFTVKAKLQGVSIDFKSEVLRIIKPGLQSNYCIKFPTYMQHRERRTSHRVPVAMGLGVVADIYAGDDEPINLRVADISAEGPGLVATPEDIKKIMRSVGNLKCTVYFPNETEN